MNKCDFCNYYDPFQNKCGCAYSPKNCTEAIRNYAQVLMSQNQNTKTKNVNISKSSNKEKGKQ